jgi:hypothetical protein
VVDDQNPHALFSRLQLQSELVLNGRPQIVLSFRRVRALLVAIDLVKIHVQTDRGAAARAGRGPRWRR